MKALVLNAIGKGSDLDDVDLAAALGREVHIEVRAARPCRASTRLGF
jgi:hypothetical protein